MWIDVASGMRVSDTTFTLGAQADSLYEYLPKMYALLGGLDETYAKMAKYMLDTARKYLIFRPMVPDEADILFSGQVLSNGNIIDLQTETQHLTCFVGGMYALSGRLLSFDHGVATGARLARGCAWAYSAFPTGIMPEVATLAGCGSDRKDASKSEDEKPGSLGPPCEWNATVWEDRAGMNAATAPKGFTSVGDPRYLLRPEAIESVFVLYRITGEREWLDAASTMFDSIYRATETEHAFSGIGDVLSTGANNKINSMEVRTPLPAVCFSSAEPTFSNANNCPRCSSELLVIRDAQVFLSNIFRS
jgi:mannosyl-oligosaccharide alpha-1,2-mannosidase